jgi:hypothetical protein
METEATELSCPVNHGFSHPFEHGRVLFSALGTPFP